MIVRTVLDRLNAKGKPSLLERREILKRVTEFEDFSTCWASDQLKAKGLVAEVSRVIGVKDSFTRMKQAQENERAHVWLSRGKSKKGRTGEANRSRICAF